MKAKNREKTEWWITMLWTGQVYGTAAWLRARGAPQAAIKRFRRINCEYRRQEKFTLSKVTTP